MMLLRGAEGSGGRGLKDWTFEPCSRVGFMVSLEVLGSLLGTVSLFTRAFTSFSRRRLHPNFFITALRKDSPIDRDDLRREGAGCGGAVTRASPVALGGLGEGARLHGEGAGCGLGRIPTR